MRRQIFRRLGGAVIQVLIVTLFAWLLFYVIARFTGASPRSALPARQPPRPRSLRWPSCSDWTNRIGSSI